MSKVSYPKLAKNFYLIRTRIRHKEIYRKVGLFLLTRNLLLLVLNENPPVVGLIYSSYLRFFFLYSSKNWVGMTVPPLQNGHSSSGTSTSSNSNISKRRSYSISSLWPHFRQMSSTYSSKISLLTNSSSLILSPSNSL